MLIEQQPRGAVASSVTSVTGLLRGHFGTQNKVEKNMRGLWVGCLGGNDPIIFPKLRAFGGHHILYRYALSIERDGVASPSQR